MAKLQCEICGGKLIGKPGGIFECEFCGTEFSTEWAKAKIQEIQGTVKVEGTVEVKGSVQVEGSANAQSLVKRGNLALEDRKWEEAERCFNDALDADPENAEAYLGLAMAKINCRNKDDFSFEYSDIDFKKYEIIRKEIERAIQFSKGELKTWLSELDEKRENVHGEIKKKLSLARKNIAQYKGIIFTNQFSTFGLKDNGKVLFAGDDILRFPINDWTNIVAIATNINFTVGLKSDGTVVSDASNYYEQCDVSKWSDITAIAVGRLHTVGLKKDGTVVAVGDNEKGQCNVENWTDIVSIAASDIHTVGLKSDGTVVAAGFNGDGRCNVSEWTDIVKVAVEGYETVGLKSNGTVVATGDNRFGQCDVFEWTDIVEVAVSGDLTVGLKSDGTVVAVGLNNKGQCNVSKWTDIIAVSASTSSSVGLKSDGKVVSAGKVGHTFGWEDIVAVSAEYRHTVGLKSDGTVVVAGDSRRFDVSKWKLFKSESEKELDYSAACAMQESGERKKLEKAAKTFKSLKNYKDSPARAAECSRIFKEKETARKQAKNESEYNKACDLAKSNSESDLFEAAKIFQGLKDFKDSAERANSCTNAYENIKAAREENERRKSLEIITALNTEKASLESELANLKGIFSGKRRKQIEGRIAEINFTMRTMK